MPHLVAAPDKFRDTAEAASVAAAMTQAAIAAGWTADAAPMSDGGEGLLSAVGGQLQRTSVTGPLGQPTEAHWTLLAAADGSLQAVIEMSKASGRALLPHPQGADPLRADTTGVGELLLAARDAGAQRIIIGCGGSATTDGGWGAIAAVGGRVDGRAALSGIELVVACDVTTPFRRAAELFGPQKGATPEQVVELTQRLGELAERYRAEFDVDVETMTGAGAAGGLAGGLAALGGRIAPGFDLVADLIGLPGRIAVADLVMTGEGHLDPPSFHGKVPGGVLGLALGHCPVLCIVGGADAEVLADPPDGIDIVSLTHRFGADRARSETVDLIAHVTAEKLATLRP
jgi:glycerate kinase